MKNLIGSMFIFLFVIFTAHSSVEAASVNDVALIVKSSPDSRMETKAPFSKQNQVRDRIQKGSRKPAAVIPVSDTYLTWKGSKGEDLTYLVDKQGNVFDEKSRERIEMPENMKAKLRKETDKLRSAHYGEMISWDQADEKLPVKTIFQVKDVETGLAFTVQRRAGSYHADVQPLTKEDTAIMKKIYNGEWSWKRRAIIVSSNEQRFAASMHGMPHGGDGIGGNEFNGHFCIHFLDSSTHGSGKIDFSHQLMVSKAAGKLDDFFSSASLYEIADAFIHGIHHQDLSILYRCLGDTKPNELLANLSRSKDQLSDIRKRGSEIEKDTSGLMNAEISVEVRYTRKGQREEMGTLFLQMIRASLTDPWIIEQGELNTPTTCRGGGFLRTEA